MGEKNIQPQTTNKKLDLHKVFAAIGIILIVMIIIGGGMWYMVQSAEDKVPVNDDVTVTKVATNSAKTASSSAIPSDWKTYNDGKYLVKYPIDWSVSTSTRVTPSSLILVENSSVGVYMLFDRYALSGPSLGPETNRNNLGESSINVGGKQLIFFERTRKDDGIWYFFGGGTAEDDLYIEASAAVEPNGATKSIIKLIISTFKFLD